jgi:hypothetical protein
MADSDMGLMRSITRCFASTCSHKVAVRPFEDLLHTLESAMQTARAGKNAVMATANGQSAQFGNETRESLGQSVRPHTASTTSLDELIARHPPVTNFDTDFQFQDFFDFGVGGEGANVFQMWPLTLATPEHEQYTQQQ